MSYVSRSLGPGETLLYVARITWATYFWAFVLAALGVFVMFVSLHPGLFLIAAGFVWFAFIGVRNSTIELAVTNYKVVAKKGFIARQTLEQRLEKIDAIDVDQSVTGRILGFGNVTIHGTGVDATPFRMISDPLTFRRKVEQAIEARLPGAPTLAKDPS